ncbi:hypothetical protein [Stappia indica]|uniref:hypothetical protein n=1 Tax=Stappia indica TaxID=538381 RepID=UPI001D192A4C|nr:hypothetical protein [Stappia indica]
MHDLVIRFASKLDVKVIGSFFDLDSAGSERLSRLMATETGFNKWLRVPPDPGDDELQKMESISISVNRRIQSIGDFDLAYTEAFRQADMLEDGFPKALYEDIGVIRLERFLSDTISIDAYPQHLAICVFEDDSIIRVPISE